MQLTNLEVVFEVLSRILGSIVVIREHTSCPERTYRTKVCVAYVNTSNNNKNKILTTLM